MNLPLVDGNYTVCVSLPTGESDCVTYLHSFIQTSVRIVSVSNNETFMDYAGNSTRISIEVENYSGYITWNWTNEDTMERPQYNWTTYANGWVTTISSGRALEEGNHSLCVTLSTNETDCVSFRVLHHPHAFLITEPTNDSFVYLRNTSNGPVLDASFNVTNYSGSVSWSLASLAENQSTVHLLDWSQSVASGWYWIYNMTSVNLTTNSSNWGWNNQGVHLQEGRYRLCANLTIVSEQRCVDFMLLHPPKRIEIHTPLNGSAITRPSFSGAELDVVHLDAHVVNHSGYVYWNVTTLNGSSQWDMTWRTSSSSWTNSSPELRSYSTSRRIGFGLKLVCASIDPDWIESPNPESRTVDCIHVRIVPRTADVDIIAFHGEFSNNSQPTQIEMMYRSANHTHGTVAVNGVHIMSLGSSFDDESQNQTNGTSSQQSVRLNVRHFVHGNNNVCIHVTSEGAENLSDCMTYFLPHPVHRLLIFPASLQTFGDGSFSLDYRMENYSGTIDWTVVNGNQSNSSSSYGSTHTRTHRFHASLFGQQEVCGSFTTNGTSIRSCVLIQLAPRVLEGGILEPTSGTILTTSFRMRYWSSNVTYGVISLNGIQLPGHFTSDSNWTDDWQNNTSNGANSWISNHDTITMSIPLGSSEICLDLRGDNQSTLTDCIVMVRMIPEHDAEITAPMNNSTLISGNVSMSYRLTNVSSHHLTSNGQPITTYAGHGSTRTVQFDLEYGEHLICLHTIDAAGGYHSDCITITVLDPEADSDSDGVPDLRDACPSTLRSAVAGTNGCSNDQMDADSDGITDDIDRCQNTVYGALTDENGCSSSQKDTDGDGVVDSFDRCPTTSTETVVDPTGCAYQDDSNVSSPSPEVPSEGLPGFGPISMLITALGASVFVSRRT